MDSKNKQAKKLNLTHKEKLPPKETLEGEIKEAITKLDELTKADLANPCVTDNVGGLEVFEIGQAHNGEWVEWYDEDGEDIDHQPNGYRSSD